MCNRFFVILVLCTFFMPTLGTYADVLVEPDNDFYARHGAQTVYLGRSFVANGEDGHVAIKYEPGSRDDIASLENGEVVYMQYSCLYDGEFWGFTFEYSGWIKLDQMLVLYDYVAFAEDYNDEFYPYNGDYKEIKESGAVIAWPWPGADTLLWTVENVATTNFYATYAYKDIQGREWGFVTYLYGNQNIWVCLSEPLNRNLPAFNPKPEPDVWISETVHADIKQYASKNEFQALIVIIVLVTMLVFGTAVLIRVFWEPNKTKFEEKKND